MTLHLRKFGETPPTADPACPTDAAESGPWRDSTLDLQRGLEVVELDVEASVHDAPQAEEDLTEP